MTISRSIADWSNISFYSATSGDYPKWLRVVVKASATGYRDSTAASDPAQVAAGVIQNYGLPSIPGSPAVGQPVTASGGFWVPTSTLAYQWQRSDTSGGSYVPIADATSATYTPTTGDYGKYLEVVVTASATGYANLLATSAPSAAVGLGTITTGTVSIAASASATICFTVFLISSGIARPPLSPCTGGR